MFPSLQNAYYKLGLTPETNWIVCERHKAPYSTSNRSGAIPPSMIPTLVILVTIPIQWLFLLSIPNFQLCNLSYCSELLVQYRVSSVLKGITSTSANCNSHEPKTIKKSRSWIGDFVLNKVKQIGVRFLCSVWFSYSNKGKHISDSKNRRL